MPSQLFKNEAISFLACKPFTYRGTEYSMGDDFPQEEANNIETLVRARFVIPVLEEGHLKPRHWHGHIRTREQAEEYLNRERVQLRMPHEYDSDEEVDIGVLTHPHTTPEPEGEGEPALPEETSIVDVDRVRVGRRRPSQRRRSSEGEDAPEGLEFDPADYTVDEVQAYLVEHPEDRELVLKAERERAGPQGNPGGVMESAFGIDHGYEEIGKFGFGGLGRLRSGWPGGSVRQPSRGEAKVQAGKGAPDKAGSKGWARKHGAGRDRRQAEMAPAGCWSKLGQGMAEASRSDWWRSQPAVQPLVASVVGAALMRTAATVLMLSAFGVDHGEVQQGRLPWPSRAWRPAADAATRPSEQLRASQAGPAGPQKIKEPQPSRLRRTSRSRAPAGVPVRAPRCRRRLPREAARAHRYCTGGRRRRGRLQVPERQAAQEEEAV